MDPSTGSSILPGPNVSDALLYLVPCGVLSILALGLCVLRIWSRMRPWPHLDDYLIAVAEIFSLAGYALIAVAAAHGWGRPMYYLSPSDQTVVFKCLFATQIIFFFNVSIIRVSVAYSLLRLSVAVGSVEKIWRWMLWSIIILQGMITVGFFIILPFQSKGAPHPWQPVQSKYAIIWGWVVGGLIISCDFLLASMPIIIIRTLNRPLREKFFISFLMGMGLLATGAAIYRTKLFVDSSDDNLLGGVSLVTWIKLEELFGIIAACLPSLKRPAEQALRRIGVISDRSSNSEMLPTFVISSIAQTQASRRENLVGSRCISVGSDYEKDGSCSSTCGSENMSISSCR